MENLKKNPLSLQLNVEDFAPASNDEKKSLVVMRESVNFWKDGMRRLRKNKIAMVSLVVILLIAFMAYVLPSFWPYSYEQQIKGSNNLAPFEYSAAEQKLIDQGENVFPHILGTDRMGRDFAVRVMMGTRVSLSVGLLASVLVLLIGATYGAISAFAGGWIDNIMMRITDILYTIPDILLIILLAMAIKEPLEGLATKPGFGWMQKLGPNMVSIFIIFALLYWVGMARIVRSQVLTLKESEYVTAARALGASGGRIIKKHLLTNCMGTLIVTTTLQIVDENGMFYDNANGGKTYISDDYDANLEEAKKLLADAGYPNGEGFPTIEYSTNDAGYHTPVAEYVQQAWGELGITVNINKVEWASFTPMRRAGDYDVSRNGWVMDYNDPSNMIELFTTTNGNNDGKYSNPEFDAAVEASKVADKSVHFQKLHEAEDILMEDAACIPVAYYNDFWLQSPSLKGTWHSPYGYWYLQYGYIEE